MVMLETGDAGLGTSPSPGATKPAAIVDDANGIVASGGGGGTRTTHQTPTTITITPNADANMRLNPIQRMSSVSR
jgi:hypothetical protein